MDRVISRAHRYDLYPSVAPRHHIPERRLLLQSLDGICPVSEQGTREPANNVAPVRREDTHSLPGHFRPRTDGPLPT